MFGGPRGAAYVPPPHMSVDLSKRLLESQHHKAAALKN